MDQGIYTCILDTFDILDTLTLDKLDILLIYIVENDYLLKCLKKENHKSNFF